MMPLNAVAVIRDRLGAMMRDAFTAAEVERLAGRPQLPALNANALERLRVSSVLPSLPDNDWIHDMVRQSKGEPSQLMCDLTS
jgi:hypothetical protein